MTKKSWFFVIALLACLALVADPAFAARKNKKGKKGGNKGGNLAAKCKTIKTIGRGQIYKTVGSTHFVNDCRRNTAGLIFAYGGGAPSSSCVELLDKNGDILAKFGLYARGAGWEARYYVCVGCGGGFNHDGQDLARLATRNTGSPEGYLDLGSTCLKVPNLGNCYNSIGC